MKKKNLIILLFLILTSIFYAKKKDVYSSLSNNFKKIIQIDNNNNKLINFDINKVDYNDLFYYYCIASEELDKLKEYKNWLINVEQQIHDDIKNLFKRSDVSNWNIKKQREFAEQLLIIMHNSIFKKYHFDANRISSIIEKGEYNCVSSSILYALFLKKYKLKSIGLETSDHVFIKIIFDTLSIDVETTNKYGFDPGNKKEFFDEFGRITGFSYVPPKDYNNRNDIDLKKLLFIVYHNMANYYYKHKNYLKAANLGYLIYQGRNDKKGKEDFEIYFNNYIAALSNEKKYLTVIEDINSYLNYIELNDDFLKIRFDLLNNYINDWYDYDDITTVNEYLLDQNEKYSSIKNNERFIEIYFYFIYKAITYYNEKKEFFKSYELIKHFNSIYTYREVDKLFINILIDEINLYEELHDYDLISKRFFEIKLHFPEYIDEINKHEKIHLVNKINHILQNGEYLEALNTSKTLLLIHPDDYNVREVTRNSFVKYTVF
ncbi:MAG: hypothetical protein KAT05_10420, partial [Spirochaetes bacterium]|nr:hypothetical protein [Spirochaetota bacterium]